MIYRFSSNYKLFNINKEASDSYFCISINSKENILLLEHPKLIDIKTSNNVLNKKPLVNIEPTFSQINEQNKNFNNSYKFDKKNKNHLEQPDNLEIKKNKVRLKKKIRHKRSLGSDDIFINNNNGLLDEESLNNDLIKPHKFSKQKKKNKLRQDVVDSNLSNISDQAILNNNEDTDVCRSITIDRPLTVQELAIKLQIPETEIITRLFLKGISVTINQVLDISIATEIAINYNFQVSNIEFNDIANIKDHITNTSSSQAVKRPPIITVFGHVDHGKTTLLDAIRRTNLVKKEIGGITQAISGYEVEWLYESSYEKLVFLDTPGHEAFSAMRLRGAQVADIALLVLAADDDLKPQSIEAIKYILNLKLPYIVVINKIDKKNINVLKIKEELAQFDILDADWGGNVHIVEVSALTGQNINQLLSTICLLAELQELRSDPNQLAIGTILEAHLDKQKGIIANVIVQNGSLKLGNLIVSGDIEGKVKVIVNSIGVKIKEALPSSIVEIWGFSSIPQAGASFQVVKDDKEAKKYIKNITNDNDYHYDFSKMLNTRITADSYSNKSQLKQLNVILKTDTQGSIEAIIYAFSRIPQEKVQINILSASSGIISNTDVQLASTTSSLIIGFNVNISSNIRNFLKKSCVTFFNFSVIYDLLDHVKCYMLDLVDPEYNKVIIGRATVQTVFYINKGSVAGCFVDSGKLKKLSHITVYRDKTIVYDGILKSLKRIKEDVEEVMYGSECGVMCDDYQMWKKQDIIESYELSPKEKVL
uniref:Translation initiation factor IF-2, chloroplastic n=1 Tax=Schimmelmannia schousboei TaxID=173468 RepID=A0A1C9C8L5_9FLOR|nr:translation initiation factor 2 [Schimmelmannia schousboei]AOM64714.1 translation initiation factor 2 [Schimmelmannia schousboei]